MIERDFINRKKKEYQIQEFIKDNLRGAGISQTKIQRTPLGEKIIISATRPGLIIGSGGSNIKKLTIQLKEEFNLDNPQIEINEITNNNLIAAVVAEQIATSLERYGTMKFKGVGHKAMADALSAGAKGIEILISGKIPSARAKVWRFYQGYIKKCGNAAVTIVDTAYSTASLKSGIVGVKVSIMPPNVRLPDYIGLREQEVVEEIKVPLVKELTEKEAIEVEEEILENTGKKTKPKKVFEKEKIKNEK